VANTDEPPDGLTICPLSISRGPVCQDSDRNRNARGPSGTVMGGATGVREKPEPKRLAGVSGPAGVGWPTELIAMRHAIPRWPW